MNAGSGPASALGEWPRERLAAALEGKGLWLDVGLATLRIRSDAASLVDQLQSVYRHFPFRMAEGWADLHVELRRARGLRRWFRPQVRFHCDAQTPFEPFPADTALPLLEWGANWLIGRRLHDVLMFHAGVVERDGLALLLPAVPGSGKSTLSAALSLRGWRLLSDEFGAYDPIERCFRAVLKPVALKNASIDVIRAFAPEAPLGPSFPNTRKGTVAHLAASADAVRRIHQPARPGAIVLPTWRAGSPTTFEALSPETAFPALAFNAFNYAVTAEAGFQAVVALVRGCPAWQLVYSDLDDAIAQLDARWTDIAGSVETGTSDER